MRMFLGIVAVAVLALASCGDDGEGGGAPLEPGSDDPGTATAVVDGEQFDDLAVTCDGPIVVSGSGLDVRVDFGSIDTESSITISTPDAEGLTATGGASDDIRSLESDGTGGSASANAEGTDVEMTWTCP